MKNIFRLSRSFYENFFSRSRFRSLLTRYAFAKLVKSLESYRMDFYVENKVES